MKNRLQWLTVALLAVAFFLIYQDNKKMSAIIDQLDASRVQQDYLDSAAAQQQQNALQTGDELIIDLESDELIDGENNEDVITGDVITGEIMDLDETVILE